MATATYKLLLFLKRRPGMSMQEFRDYYENVHSKIGEKYSDGVLRYVRRYLQPLPDPHTGKPEEMEYDVVTELWFEDRSVFERVAALLSSGVMHPDVVEDEKRLFDRPKMRYAAVVECDSDLSRRAKQ